MYSDEDGLATKQSQAAYDTRMRILLSTTSFLSWVGFGAAILNGEYTRENSLLTLSLKQSDLIQWSKFLWVSCVHLNNIHIAFYNLKLKFNLAFPLVQ